MKARIIKNGLGQYHVDICLVHSGIHNHAWKWERLCHITNVYVYEWGLHMQDVYKKEELDDIVRGCGCVTIASESLMAKHAAKMRCISYTIPQYALAIMKTNKNTALSEGSYMSHRVYREKLITTDYVFSTKEEAEEAIKKFVANKDHNELIARDEEVVESIDL